MVTPYIRLWLIVFHCLALAPGLLQAQVAIEFGQVEQSPSWFDSWLYNGQSETNMKNQWKWEADVELQRLAPLNLTETQIEKLRLAASGDVSRFLRLVNQKREETKDRTPDQNTINEIQQILKPLFSRLREGLFAGDSLFQRTIPQILSDEQLSTWNTVQKQQADRRREAHVRLFVAKADLRVAMTAAQRTKLVERILRKLVPLEIPPKQESAVMLLVFRTLQRDEMADFLDEEQLKLLIPTPEAERFEHALVRLGIKIEQ